jgi:hypothetical protein
MDSGKKETSNLIINRKRRHQIWLETDTDTWEFFCHHLRRIAWRGVPLRTSVVSQKSWISYLFFCLKFLYKFWSTSWATILNKTLVIKNKYCKIFLKQSVSKSIVSKHLDKTLAIKYSMPCHMYKFSLSIISKLRQFSRLSQLNWHIVSHTSYNTGTNSLFPPTVQSSYLLHTYWYTSHTHLMWSKLRRRIQAEFCLLFSYLGPFCSYPPLVTLIFISNRKVAMDLNTVKLCWIYITLN